jgi:hypothetical protein
LTPHLKTYHQKIALHYSNLCLFLIPCVAFLLAARCRVVLRPGYDLRARFIAANV